jgi:hemoglobin/transferrin/lactoferrin receptor protein
MNFRLGRSALMASVSLLAMSTGPALAQDASGRVSSAQDEITISAERTPSTVYNSTGTVTVITDREIERNLVQGPRDLVRNEPGVAVSSSVRAGAGNFFIRGIGDNRVRLEVDGVRVPDYPGSNVGPGLYSRDLIDYGSLRSIEVIRGPASALYGSDAIGGVVSFHLKDPSDYLRQVGRDWYAGVSATFSSIDRSFAHTYTGAAQGQSGQLPVEQPPRQADLRDPGLRPVAADRRSALARHGHRHGLRPHGDHHATDHP